MASSGDENIPLHLYHAITRGLERLVVSFSLSREDSDSLVKFSIDRYKTYVHKAALYPVATKLLSLLRLL